MPSHTIAYLKLQPCYSLLNVIVQNYNIAFWTRQWPCSLSMPHTNCVKQVAQGYVLAAAAVFVHYFFLFKCFSNVYGIYCDESE